jgi:hypothetical protein
VEKMSWRVIQYCKQLSNKHLMMYIPWLIEFKMEQPDNEPKGNHSNQEIVIT